MTLSRSHQSLVHRHRGWLTDLEVVSDASGNVSGTLPTCTPTAMLVATDPLLEETKPTYEFHSIYGYQEDGTLAGEEFNSVSEVTYQSFPPCWA